MNDMTNKTLAELLDIALRRVDCTAEQQANAEYELDFRLKMVDVMAKGGDRPIHNPPNP